MNGYDAQWRKVIAEIRYVYNGKLLSAANYGNKLINFILFFHLNLFF